MTQLALFSIASNAHEAIMLMTRRLTQLFAGLALYGLSMALMVRATLGLDPWDVLHQGLSQLSGWSFGLIVNAVGVTVLLLWIPLRQKPGFGTVANVIVIGLVVDVCLKWIPDAQGLPWRAAMLIAGIVLNGVASGAYIGAGLGPGPRDGLMTGIVARTGWPVKYVRTAIELAVIAVGWSLGGSVGLGTVLYAVSIGPLVHVFLPLFTIKAAAKTEAPAPVSP